MKPCAVLLLCLLAAGCLPSRRAAERIAVKEAEETVTYYLPRLAQDPTIASGEFFEPQPIARPGANPFLDERHRNELQHFHQAHLAALEKLGALGTQQFHGLTGEGVSDPVWNIQGHHYVMADRSARFGSNTIRVTLYIMNPRSLSRRRDPGLTITNDAQATKQNDVGALRFMVRDAGMSRMDVFVSHSGVKE